MATKPTLSIVIPAYNEEENLAATLRSIARQTVPPHEVIVVDNNSTDNTARIARRFKFVTVISEAKQGIANAHHAGFARASCELIARIDAETLLPPDWVSRVLRFYGDQSHSKTTLIGAGYYYNLKAPRITNAVLDAHFRIASFVLGHTLAWGPNMIVPKAVWRANERAICRDAPFDDIDISIHLYHAGMKLHWDKTLVVGAKIRHCESAASLWRYARRGPATLKHHNSPRWILGVAVVAALFPIQYTLIKLLTPRQQMPTQTPEQPTAAA